MSDVHDETPKEDPRVTWGRKYALIIWRLVQLRGKHNVLRIKNFKQVFDAPDSFSIGISFAGDDLVLGITEEKWPENTSSQNVTNAKDTPNSAESSRKDSPRAARPNTTPGRSEKGS